METAACLECYYKSGSPSYLPFHYKMKHNDKISKCTCGDNILSGICLNKARSKFRGIISKCSSSSSSFSFSPNGEGASDPGTPTGAKPHSISNLRSSWGTKGEAPFTDSNSDSVSNSNSSSNSSPTSNSSFTSKSSHTSSFTNNKINLTNKV